MDNLDFLELAGMRKQLYLRVWTAVIQSDHTPDKAFNNIPAPSSCCECENWKFSGFFLQSCKHFCLFVGRFQLFSVARPQVAIQEFAVFGTHILASVFSSK